MKLELDLDKINCDNNWGDTVADIIRDEMKSQIKSYVRKIVKENRKIKRAVEDNFDVFVQQLIGESK